MDGISISNMLGDFCTLSQLGDKYSQLNVSLPPPDEVYRHP